jgi:hypothetical protein
MTPIIEMKNCLTLLMLCCASMPMLNCLVREASGGDVYSLIILQDDRSFLCLLWSNSFNQTGEPVLGILQCHLDSLM